MRRTPSKNGQDDSDEGYEAIASPSAKERAKFKAQIEIDKLDMDNEVAQQPVLNTEVGERMEMAVSFRDQIKFDLDQASAELDQQLRRSYEDHEKKPTDKAIAAEIETDPKIVRLKRKLLDASSEVRLWGVLKAGFEQRKDMLKLETQLYCSAYYDRTSISGARSALDDAAADRVRKAAGEERRNRPPRERE